MNFSIVLASRERIGLLDSLLKSLEANTADKVNTEVIICIDDDDHLTRRYSERLKSSCSFARMVTRPRSRNLNEDYLNWAWRNFATGDYIVVCNDDCVFSTPNWDQVALGRLNKFLEDKPDGIVYGWIEDALIERAGGLNYCCFPLVSHAAAKVLGWVMPPEFTGWGADIGLWRVYSPTDRVCDLSCVRIDHISYHSGTRPRDHVSYHVEQISIGTPNPIIHYDPNPAIHKLVDHIRKSR
jgi:hypothetical protein